MSLALWLTLAAGPHAPVMPSGGEADMQQSSYKYPDKNIIVSPVDAACSAFSRDMKSLYMLSLMLTADLDSAESCLMSSLDDCMTMKPFVSEWTNGWTRRVLVKNAVKLMRPTVGDGQPVDSNVGLKPALHALMRLEKFERFVFVLSILEGYSDRECSVLLGPSARHIMGAKVRALGNLTANLRSLPAQISKNSAPVN
jgi:hypothetical protein